MSPEWVQVRLRRDTAKELREFALQTFKQATLDNAGVDFVRGDGISFDAAVRVLLYKEGKEAARKRLYGQQKRGGPKTHLADRDESE